MILNHEFGFGIGIGFGLHFFGVCVFLENFSKTETRVKPNDLRGILHYIPRFRGQRFVIALDGAIVAEENFANVLLDIAVLHSLGIGVITAYGVAHQIAQMAKLRASSVSDLRGEGRTDDATLELAIRAANRVAHEILQGFSTHELRAATSNAIKALPIGILGGIDQCNTGKVERIDTKLLATLLEKGVVPVISPLGFDGNGRTFRINSDAIAVKIAIAIDAVKLIYITTQDGIMKGETLIREMPACELESELKKARIQCASKAQCALDACRSGVSRVHVINGRTNEGLLAEVFSGEGVGTLIYAGGYREIRPARKEDLRTLIQLTRDSMLSEELSARTRQEIAEHLDDYFLFEIDRHPIACVALHLYQKDRKGELASLCVSHSHEGQGIGRRLVCFVEECAQKAGAQSIFVLSTQAYAFFQNKAGFEEGSVEDLPECRVKPYLESGRNSKILIKTLRQKAPISVRSHSAR